MKTKRIVLLALIVSLCLTAFVFPVSAASAPDIVRDGLVAWYDGANNSNGEQDYETTVWKDLTGNGHHLLMRLNETNYWTDNAFHVDASSYYFPDEIVDVVNGEAYTIEFVAGELTFTAKNYITLMCSDNDELSIFVRVPYGNDTDSNFEYKYNDDNTDRPKIDNGAETINNATISITFDLTDPLDGECLVYINGVAMGRGVPTVKNVADSVTFGHENPQRAWSGDIYGFRFYDRALAPEEVMANADADDMKYRKGNYYPPKKQYDGADEDVDPGLTGKFKNNLIPFTAELDLVPYDGFYGTESIIDNIYAYEGEWPGIRLIQTPEPEVDSGGNPYTPEFQVNYEKYCRKTGLTPLLGENTPFVVLKIKVEEGFIGDMLMFPMAGVYNSWMEVSPVNSYYGSAECSGDTEYLIYDLTDAWDGQINKFKFVIQNMSADAVVYLDEIALFADEDSALIYAGELLVETEEVTTNEETVAPETNAETETTENTMTVPETTEEQTTETIENTGCSSIVGLNTAMILTAIAAAFVWKKK